MAAVHLPAAFFVYNRADEIDAAVMDEPVEQ